MLRCQSKIHPRLLPASNPEPIPASLNLPPNDPPQAKSCKPFATPSCSQDPRSKDHGVSRQSWLRGTGNAEKHIPTKRCFLRTVRLILQGNPAVQSSASGLRCGHSDGPHQRLRCKTDNVRNAQTCTNFFRSSFEPNWRQLPGSKIAMDLAYFIYTTKGGDISWSHEIHW